MSQPKTETGSSRWNRLPDSIRTEVEFVRASRAVYFLGIVIAAVHLWFNSIGNVETQVQNILHFAGFIVMAALLYPLSRRPLPRRLDIAFALLVAASAIYLIWADDYIYDRGVRLVASDWVAGVIVILGAIEYTRRTTGWIIPLLIVLALSYITWWGSLISGVFSFGGLKPETMLFRSLYGDDALFGSIARISATFVFVFIIFGAFLLRSGAGDFVIHLSRAVAGRLIGGPGIVAVLGSGLTGTISGSAIANTASTGVITIPMMKQAGFPPKFAAAIEAAASTGGQLMPPIMGAGAFVMASYTEIPYATIVAVSLVPALLYFFSLAFYVRFEAFKQGMTVHTDGAEPLLPLVFREGLSFIVPVGLLIALLVLGYTPVYAGVIAIVAVIVSSWFTPTKMGLTAIFDALVLGSRNMVMTAVLLCAVGLIVNVIATAGIGNTFSLMISQWAGGSLLIAMLLVAVASLVLGMGLPVTASYIVLATLSAPALYALMANVELAQALAAGHVSDDVRAIVMLAAPQAAASLDNLSLPQAVDLVASMPPETTALLQPLLLDPQHLAMVLLAAHLIIFWLSQDSNVTPPVCLCAFTAAAIARTPPMATGFMSWMVAKSLYVIPLLFAYTPLVTGSWPEVLETGAFALAGLYAFVAALKGWHVVRLGLVSRLVMGAVALALLWPLPRVAHLLALVVLVGLVAYLHRNRVTARA